MDLVPRQTLALDASNPSLNFEGGHPLLVFEDDAIVSNCGRPVAGPLHQRTFSERECGGLARGRFQCGEMSVFPQNDHCVTGNQTLATIGETEL